MNKPIFLCDMDNTLFAWSAEIVRQLNEIAHPIEKPITEEELGYGEFPPYIQARIRSITKQHKFYLNLPIIERGFDIFHAARQIGYDCHILTKGPYLDSQGWTDKYDCIRQHLGGDVKIHIVSDKSIVYGAVLYDDYPPYVDSWIANRPRGLAIIPDRPENRSYDIGDKKALRHFYGSGHDNTDQIIKALDIEFTNRTNGN